MTGAEQEPRPDERYPYPTTGYVTDEANILHDIRELLAAILDELKNGPSRRAVALAKLERETEAAVAEQMRPHYDQALAEKQARLAAMQAKIAHDREALGLYKRKGGDL